MGAPARVSGNIDRKRFRSSALWCKMEALGKRVAMVAQGAPLLAETLDKLGVGEWSRVARLKDCLGSHPHKCLGSYAPWAPTLTTA